jgi:XRE family aerobic/anaerobic benzoate catabolism transcriptional regulator
MRSSTQSRIKSAQEAAYLIQVAKCVREQRQAKGMSRRELAEIADVSERYVAQIESAGGNVSILVLRRLARALNVPIERLLPDDAAPRS